MNHLSYADDLYVFVGFFLSSHGMIQLLNICNNFATSHSLTYYLKKFYLHVFTPKSINFFKQNFTLNNNVENCKYLGIVIHLHSGLYDIARQLGRPRSPANRFRS